MISAEKRPNYFSTIVAAKFLETAGFDEEDTSPNVDFTSQIAELARANALLDKKKNQISLDIISSLTGKTACEKAAESYTVDFWLTLPLSWPSVLELMQEVTLILKRYKTSIPQSWITLGDFDISTLDEPDNMEDDSTIINSVERRNAENV